VSTADIYWESTLPRTKKRRQAAAQEADTLKRINVDKSFYNLMDAGFQRRISKEFADIDYDQPITPSIAKFLPKFAALKTSDQLELRKSKEEQLKDLKRRQMMKRSGVMKLVPQSLHKYFDYLMTLRKDPAKGDMTRNLLVGTIFSFITLSNARVRMAFLYSILGNVAVMSILLTRNMPKLDVPPGMDRRRVVNWSDSSFKTAVAITLLFALPTGLLAMLLCALTPLPTIMKARLSLASSIMGSAYFTAFYEVHHTFSIHTLFGSCIQLFRCLKRRPKTAGGGRRPWKALSMTTSLSDSASKCIAKKTPVTCTTSITTRR